MTNKPETEGTFRQKLLMVITALVVPSAAGLTFRQFVARAPWRAGVLLVLYEILLMFLAFLSKIWNRLEGHWVDKISAALIGALTRTFTLYERRYLRHLKYIHRFFDVKGLGTQGIFTLHMEQVFVDLSIVPQPPHNVTGSPLGNLSEIIPGRRYSIRDFLVRERLRNPNLAILGPPGSGKTTLLKHVTLTLAGNKIPKKFRRTPVLIYLRETVDAITRGEDLGLVAEFVANKIHTQAPVGWFESKLKRGKCVVMFDGLDEIPSPDVRRTVSRWVDTQIKKYPVNRYMLTSRPFGYRSNPIEGLTVFEVRPFSADQVRRFVHNWYLANESAAAGDTTDAGVKMVAAKGADDLLTRIRKNQDLADLAVNPLLLTMIATVHRFKSSLPGKRVELYAEICDVFLGNRQRAKGIEPADTDLTPAQKRRVLEPLAYEMMVKRVREIGREEALDAIRPTLRLVSRKITPDQFFKDVEELSGVLLEREHSVYSFAHLTFQEYLAAAHIRSHRLEAEVLSRIDDSWWHETLRLYSAQGDASPIIRACLSGEQPTIEALTLATQCMEEAFEVNPDVALRLESVLSKAKALDAQRLLARQRLKLRIRKLMRSDETHLVDDSLVTSAEYLIFLDECSSNGVDRRPDHWISQEDDAENAARPIEGVRRGDAEAFCMWLSERESSGCLFRIPTFQETVASPLNLTSHKTPLRYWATDKGEKILVSATEFGAPYFPDLLHRTEEDLGLILRDDLILAGGVEWMRELWNVNRLRLSARDRISNSLKMGPDIDLDGLTGPHSWKMPRTSGGLLSRVALLALRSELGRQTDDSLTEEFITTAKQYCKAAANNEDALGALTIGRLIKINPHLDRVAPPGSILAESVKSVFDTLADHRNRLGTTGAPLQGKYFRGQVAANLVLPLLGDHFSASRPATAYTSYREGTSDNAVTRRSLLRFLCLVACWPLISQDKSKHDARDSDTQSSEALARFLLQVFVDLTILEERINGLAPATEGIRAVRERSLEALSAAFLAENKIDVP